MNRWRAIRPTTERAEVVLRHDVAELELSPYDRRARAAERAWRLMSTSIPTREILASYLDDVLVAP